MECLAVAICRSDSEVDAQCEAFPRSPTLLLRLRSRSGFRKNFNHGNRRLYAIPASCGTVAFIGEEGVLDRVTAVLPLENLWRPGARVFLRWNDRRVGCSASCFSHVGDALQTNEKRLPES
jgi:hypothetical protein